MLSSARGGCFRAKDGSMLSTMTRPFYIAWLVILPVVLLGGCATVRPPAHAQASDRTMMVTAYCKCKKCCGWKRTWYGKPVDVRTGKTKKIGRTASGTRAKEGRTIAADTSKYPFGTVMYVKGYGYGRVEDRGSKITQEKIDLFFRSHKRALQWGRRTMTVRVWTRQ